MPASFSGGCACGAIRYECTAEPLAMSNCHCRDCQRASGSAFFPGVYVAKANLTIKGNATYYENVADSGQTQRRGFCRECGSPVFVRPLAYPNLVGLWAGSLDDPSWYQPAVDIWTASAQPWDSMSLTVPKIKTGPTKEQVQELITPGGS
jgi:hypothetical protein